MGPKFGATHNQVLAAAGINTALTPTAAAQQIEGDAGWAYVDQSSFCPQLAALEDLRTRIVKRPVITTVEVLARPLIANGKTHLVTGYVHKPYPPVYSMLARHVGFDSCLLIRGTEGGVIPSLRQLGRAVSYTANADDVAFDFEPSECGIAQTVRAAALPDAVLATKPDATLKDGPEFSVQAMAQAAAGTGIEALHGSHGAIRDGLIYGGALVLRHVRGDSLKDGAAAVARALDTGAALARLQAAARL